MLSTSSDICAKIVATRRSSVTYESGKKLHRLGKALARGSNFKALADAAMENLKEAIESTICSNISKECKRLCSTANPSLLRGMTKEAMLNFSWVAVGKELQTKAPLSLRCILAAANPSNGTTTIYHGCSDFAEETR